MDKRNKALLHFIRKYKKSKWLKNQMIHHYLLYLTLIIFFNSIILYMIYSMSILT